MTWNMRLPHCQKCGKTRPHVVSVRYFDRGEWRMRLEWLCEDCDYGREHPDAAPAVKMPRERRPKKLQKETLFDDSVLDADKGKKLREEAVARVTQHAPPDWTSAAFTMIRRIAERRTEFTTDEVWDELARWGVERPPEPRAMAGPIRQAQRHGIIAMTDRVVPSAVPWAHRRNTRVWRSLLT